MTDKKEHRNSIWLYYMNNLDLMTLYWEGPNKHNNGYL